VACESACATIILEAGEVCKIEPGVVETGMRGLRNVLVHLGMLNARLRPPAYQTQVFRTFWARAEVGGLLRFHVAPGDLVDANQPIATVANVYGRGRDVVVTPDAGVVLGMATYPAIKPGEPICHIAVPRKKMSTLRKALARSSDTSLHHRLRQDLATNLAVDAIDEDDSGLSPPPR